MQPLASKADVVQRLGRPLTPLELKKIEGLLEEASVLATPELGCFPFTADTPKLARETTAIVVSRMVARVLERQAANTLGAEQITESAGQVQRVLNFGSGSGQVSGGPWLAATDKTTLKGVCGEPGLQSIAITTGRTGRYRALDRGGRATGWEQP